jgi:hypothetical protein
MDFLAVPPLPNRLRSALSYPASLASLVTCWGFTHAAEAKVVDGVCKPGDPPQGWTCGNAKPHRGQACAPAGGNGLSQPGQRVANRIPQWAQNCQCASISRRQSRHSWRNW